MFIRLQVNISIPLKSAKSKKPTNDQWAMTYMLKPVWHENSGGSNNSIKGGAVDPPICASLITYTL